MEMYFPNGAAASFSMKRLSRMSLKVRTRCGPISCARDTRCAIDLSTPRCFASDRTLQCAAALGVVCSVLSTIVRATSCAGAVRLRAAVERVARSSSVRLIGTAVRMGLILLQRLQHGTAS